MKLKQVTRISLFSAMIAVSVYLIPPIYVPLINVSFTLQTLFIILIGFLLTPLEAFLSVFIYVLVGALGFPVFSGYRGGLSTLFGPTGGFILMFPIISLLISILKSKEKKHFFNLVMGFVIGVVLLYLVANLWLSYFLSINYFTSLSGLLIFIPFDMLKLILAYLIYLRLPKEIFS
ncbi:MAG: biotin transporter BioY [Tenericutes bacterium HGW-Tenericutes-2]|jgi:biotin transport system substrate-specific component|nr:MAG: biotin transporter BioY [Tenericutes bacterium HGW-Tenericutes-2]